MPLFRRRPREDVHAVAESAPAAVEDRVYVPRRGFEVGYSGSDTYSAVQQLGQGVRQQLLQELYDVYVQCTWASACIDVIARTATAGGLKLVPNPDAITPDGDDPVETPAVANLRALLMWVNPTQDMVQLCRNLITQLQVFGDAYVEIVRLGNMPYALYVLNAATMAVIADEHGQVLRYVQTQTGFREPVNFEPGDIIHVSLDDPQGGPNGISPTQKAILPITGWLYTTACLKETMRGGNAPRLHVDLPKESQRDADLWYEQYMSRNRGPKNMSTPVVTLRGGHVSSIAPSQVAEFISSRNSFRDEIVSEYGVPPHKVSIVETGNLGGGTGEAQDVTFQKNVVSPVAALLLEKLNFHLVAQGFGIRDWHLEFPQVDYRDSKTIEDIRQTRFRSGAITLNRYRRDINEPEIEGGDDALIIERGMFLFPRDIPAYVAAEMAKNSAAWIATGTPLPAVDASVGITPEMRVRLDDEARQMAVLNAGAVQPVATVPPAPAAAGAKPSERTADDEMAALSESFRRYRTNRRRALKELPAVREESSMQTTEVH